MKRLKIDDKWSIEYDPNFTDRPGRLFRYDLDAELDISQQHNYVSAMFYALLDKQPKIKPLEWVEDSPNGLWGNGLFTYMIREGGEGYYTWKRVNSNTTYIPDEPGVQAAKDAAQADYEECIMRYIV